MAVPGEDIVSIIKRQIEEYGARLSMVEVGTVVEAGDGIARAQGLSGVGYNELLEFEDGTIGLALNLEEDTVGVAIMGDSTTIKEGDQVKATGRIIQIAVGDELLGRVIDPLGRPLDGRGPISATRMRPVERIAPNVVVRQSVRTPVQTGIKAIDAMIPIGRGQRELIIGDRTTGKTAVILDTIINQKGQDLFCVYVAIGQKASKVAQVVATLEQYGAMDYTVVVAANASDPAPLQYIAPYAGCTIGEEFMERGKDAFIAYDDLSKHAWAYRQMSLLLRRPAGREAYPGDVFYLHSRLLERAAKMHADQGGGSLTAVPVIETQAGDLSAYIPTNVISITDGQIYLEPDLFNAGIRPAVNVGLSVSRVGGDAQTRAMKRVAGRLRLEVAQYNELVSFAQFGTADLDRSTRMQIEKGQRIIEVLKQGQYEPLPLYRQVCILYTVVNDYLADIPLNKIDEFESGLFTYLDSTYPQIGQAIMQSLDLAEDTEELLKRAVQEFKGTFAVA